MQDIETNRTQYIRLMERALKLIGVDPSSLEMLADGTMYAGTERQMNEIRNAKDELEQVKIALFKTMREHQCLPFKPLTLPEQVRALGERMRQYVERIEDPPGCRISPADGLWFASFNDANLGGFFSEGVARAHAWAHYKRELTNI